MIVCEREGRNNPRALLRRWRNPGHRRLYRRQPEAGARRGQCHLLDDSVQRRSLHGRVGQDSQPGKKGPHSRFTGGCSLAESCPADKLDAYQQELRAAGRDIVTVAYINTSAAVKSLCDWIVTSGNAREIVERVPEDKEILFVPDQHLGRYLEEVTGRKMILWPGSCMVHEIFSVQDMLRAKRNNPGSIIIAHPECPHSVLEHCDFIGGTEKLRQHVMSFEEPQTFLVATDAAMIHAFEKSAPQHKFIPVPGIMTDSGETCACNRCPHMARNTLVKVRDCLKNGEPEIHWQPYFDKAQEVLRRSLLD